MKFDVKKELKNMFLIENSSTETTNLKKFTKSLKKLDKANHFPAKSVPVFANSIDGKKCLCINIYDIFRYATADSRDEDLDIAKYFEDICKQNSIDNYTDYDFVVTIPQAQIKFVKESAEEENSNYTKMPTKLGELDRFINYLKYDCINKGIQVAEEEN